MSTQIAVVLRRSHQKSKQGCQSCKRRRVKCDELHPTCQRCHKGGLPCVYLAPAETGTTTTNTTNTTTTTTTDNSRSVSWPTAIEQACSAWKEGGESPFPPLYLDKSPSWHSLSLKELRYLYQIGLVESMLRLSGTSDMCPPWGEIPMMFQLANHFDFVTYTLAAGSASRLATISKSREAVEDAARYHKLAMEGMTQAMQSLTRDNADAILGAALGCSYTLTDHRSLMLIAEYGSKVSKQLRDWSKPSVFLRPLSFRKQPPLWEESENESPYKGIDDDLHGDLTGVSSLLLQGIESLSKLSACFREELSFAAMIRRLRDVLRVVHARLGTPIPAADQYRIILPFTCWFSRDAASCYIPVSKKDPRVLGFLLHMYAVVVTLTVALPATDFSIFASFRVRAVLEICQALEEKESFWCTPCNQFHQSQRLMPFALDAVRHYRRQGRGRDDLFA